MQFLFHAFFDNLREMFELSYLGKETNGTAEIVAPPVLPANAVF